MILLDPFAAGLGVIALQINAGLTEAHVDAYHAALAGETDAQEWEAFARTAAARHGWRFLPTVPELVDALREFRGCPRLDAEAVAAYERVTACGVYTAEAGTSWTYRGVLKACGRAAADAFLAAGGGSAWATSWKETDRRQAFVAAYQQIARQEPASRALPPAQEQAQITDGTPANSGDSLSAAEAAVLLERVRERLAVPAAEPRPRMTEAEAEARVAELQRQAAQITEGVCRQ